MRWRRQAASRNTALLAHLKMTREDMARVQRLVEARTDTEGALTSEACAVLSSLTKCVADGERFHAELARQARDETDRRAKSREFHQRFAASGPCAPLLPLASRLAMVCCCMRFAVCSECRLIAS